MFFDVRSGIVVRERESIRREGEIERRCYGMQCDCPVIRCQRDGWRTTCSPSILLMGRSQSKACTVLLKYLYPVILDSPSFHQSTPVPLNTIPSNSNIYRIHQPDKFLVSNDENFKIMSWNRMKSNQRLKIWVLCSLGDNRKRKISTNLHAALH